MNSLYHLLSLAVLYSAFMFSSVQVNGQIQTTPELISSGGDYVELEDLHVSYSIGEPVVGPVSTGNLQLTQGFQQADMLVTSIQEFTNWGFNVYPNPTAEQLVLDLYGLPSNSGIMNVYNSSGAAVLENKSVTDGINYIDVSALPPGNYEVILLLNDKSYLTAKIIKL